MPPPSDQAAAAIETARRNLLSTSRSLAQQVVPGDTGPRFRMAKVTAVSGSDVSVDFGDGTPVDFLSKIGGSLTVDDIVLVLIDPPVATVIGPVDGGATGGGGPATLPISEDNGTTAVLADLYTTNFDIYVNDDASSKFAELTFIPANAYGLQMQAFNSGVHITASTFILGDSADVLFEHTGGGGATFEINFPLTMIDGNSLFSGYLDLTEISVPATPPTDIARLYAKDNGSGDTVLAFKRDDGTETVLSGPGAASNYWRFGSSKLDLDPATTAGVNRFLAALSASNDLIDLNLSGSPYLDLLTTGNISLIAGRGPTAGKDLNLQSTNDFNLLVTRDVNITLGRDVNISGGSGDINLGQAGVVNLTRLAPDYATATVAVGTLNGKVAVYNSSGTLLGYMPVYTTIT